MTALLGTVLLLQLSLTLGWLLTRLLVRLGPGPRATLWAHRLLLLAALVAPLLVGRIAPQTPWRAPAQVAATAPGEPVQLRLDVAATPATVVLPAADLAPGWPLLLLVLVGALLPVARDTWRLRRLVAAARPWRRVGGVDVRVAAGLPAPCAACLPRPVVLLDPATAGDPGLRALALRHELQHLRQGDPQLAWAWRLLRALLGWNPAVGAWARLASELEEQACDAAVVAHRRVSPRAYGHLLLASASLAPPVALATGLAPRSTLHRRLHMLALPPPPRPLRAFLFTLVGSAALVGAAWAGRGMADDRRVSTDEFGTLVQRAARADVAVPDHPVIHGQLSTMVAKGSGFYARGLDRRAEWQPLVDGALADAGLPPLLAAVPLVESGYSNWGAPGAPEPSSGAPGDIPGRGLWMFIPATAREYGLKVDDTVDQRLDPQRETAAAVALLSDLHDRYGDWGLALAGYNMGPDAVDRAIELGGSRDPWELTQRGLINEYAATVMAAGLLLEAPEVLD